MATTEPAHALGLDDTTGQLTPGYSADAVVVHGDPLADLGALGSVAAVIAAGRNHDPTDKA
ncbi:amidohydrolase family protein [Streptomyces sp. SDT5-1]|uniref:amidohydrolase family protein n=1 Tax=Streptomyces sp. SDT5-1 TaxID=3406418 RepID=UPI003FCEF852